MNTTQLKDHRLEATLRSRLWPLWRTSIYQPNSSLPLSSFKDAGTNGTHCGRRCTAGVKSAHALIFRRSSVGIDFTQNTHTQHSSSANVIYSEFRVETGFQRLVRRLKEEPLIPLGLGLTIWAFVRAAIAVRRGRSLEANKMFWRRIYAQGFTVAAVVGGNLYWRSDREKRREWEKAVTERKALQKHEAWLRELELRDAEEQDIQSHLARNRKMEDERQSKLRHLMDGSTSSEPTKNRDRASYQPKEGSFMAKVAASRNDVKDSEVNPDINKDK